MNRGGLRCDSAREASKIRPEPEVIRGCLPRAEEQSENHDGSSSSRLLFCSSTKGKVERKGKFLVNSFEIEL
jgi:hypothetical protein